MTESLIHDLHTRGPNSFFAAWTGDISETLPFCCAEEDCSGSWLGRARAEPTTERETQFLNICNNQFCSVLTSWKVFKITCTDLGVTNVIVAIKLNLNNLYKNQSQAWF